VIGGDAVTVVRVQSLSPELLAMVDNAEKKLRSHRGGLELLSTILDGGSTQDLVERLVARGELWTFEDEGEPRGFAICRSSVVEALYVSPAYRRRGVARMMLKTLLALEDPPKDAYALPGDRAMKSLYESFGWKARLLTMRGE
jgi:GNAT superfamily N-acetyltransferase